MIWRRQRGVVSIEVALGLLGFLGLIFYWIEVSYMGFVSSVVDYAVVEASKVSRYDPGSNDNYYTDRFKTVLALSDSFWAKFLDVDKFTMAVNYYKSVENLAAGQSAASSRDAPLALYRLSYPYQPLFLSWFMPPDRAMSISREVIAVQEYERSEFDH